MGLGWAKNLLERRFSSKPLQTSCYSHVGYQRKRIWGRREGEWSTEDSWPHKTAMEPWPREQSAQTWSDPLLLQAEHKPHEGILVGLKAMALPWTGWPVGSEEEPTEGSGSRLLKRILWNWLTEEKSEVDPNESFQSEESRRRQKDKGTVGGARIREKSFGLGLLLPFLNQVTKAREESSVRIWKSVNKIPFWWIR